MNKYLLKIKTLDINYDTDLTKIVNLYNDFIHEIVTYVSNEKFININSLNDIEHIDFTNDNNHMIFYTQDYNKCVLIHDEENTIVEEDYCSKLDKSEILVDKIPLDSENKDRKSLYVTHLENFVLNYLIDIYASKNDTHYMYYNKGWESLDKLYKEEFKNTDTKPYSDNMIYMIELAQNIIKQHSFDVSFLAKRIYEDFPKYDIVLHEKNKSYDNFIEFMQDVLIEHHNLRPYQGFCKHISDENSDKFYELLDDFNLENIVYFIKNYYVVDLYKKYVTKFIDEDSNLMLLLQLC